MTLLHEISDANIVIMQMESISIRELQERGEKVLRFIKQALKVQDKNLNKSWNTGFIEFEQYCLSILNNIDATDNDEIIDNLLKKANYYLTEYYKYYKYYKLLQF